MRRPAKLHDGPKNAKQPFVGSPTIAGEASPISHGLGAAPERAVRRPLLPSGALQPRRGGTKWRGWPSAGAIVLIAVLTAAMGSPADAQRSDGEAKPYDAKLHRLAEILGAVHYLRELCGANEGQIWRERMSELLKDEGSSALRRAMITTSFNNGYRSYNRTYQSCTPSAQTSIGRFLTEGAQLADELAKVPR